MYVIMILPYVCVVGGIPIFMLQIGFGYEFMLNSL